MEVNEETLGENNSSIPLKEQERNGRNARNAYISRTTFSRLGLVQNSMQAMKDTVTLPSLHICCRWNIGGGKVISLYLVDLCFV